MTDSPRSDFSAAGLYADPTAVEIEMYLKSRDLTLGNGLADPPTLPWKEERWGAQWLHGDQSAFAFVQIFELHPDAPDGRPWMAFCAGPPEGVVLDEWHSTAEAAKAAVEEHIAAHLNGEA